MSKRTGDRTLEIRNPYNLTYTVSFYFLCNLNALG